MRYLCGNKVCGKVFLHTAKLTTYLPVPKEITQPELPLIINGKLQNDFVESAVCPHCYSKIYSEAPETEPQITSLKSVPLDEVDDWLAKGYVVKDTFAKTATLIKREEAKGQ